MFPGVTLDGNWRGDCQQAVPASFDRCGLKQWSVEGREGMVMSREEVEAKERKKGQRDKQDRTGQDRKGVSFAVGYADGYPRVLP